MQYKKNILFIVPSFSILGVKGYEKVVIQWVNALADQYNIHIINLGGKKNDLVFNSELGVTIHERSVNKFIQLLNAALALMWLRPLQVAFLSSRKNNKYVSDLQNQYSVHANVFVTIRTHSVTKNIDIPRDIILAVDSMTLNFFGKFKQSKGLKRFLFLVEYWLLRLHEKKILSKYRKSVFVSQRDARLFENLNTRVVPLATQIPDMKTAGLREVTKILFTGNMSYEPNRSAVAWFYDEVFVKLKKIDVNCKFVVCGRFANNWTYLHNHPDIQVKSDVPNIFDEILDCDIYVAPMQSGSGMQFKIIEAMACAKPVITSTFGLGSISCQGNGKDIMIAENPKIFFKTLMKLIEDKNLRRTIGVAARETVINNYGQNIVNREIRELMNDF